MKTKTILLTLVFALTCGFCSAQDFIRAKTFEDAYKASCRVSVSNARGTGTFVGYDRSNNRCIILTNYHVVSNNNSATLDFWTNGVRQSISGKVFARFYDARRPYDFALISVDPNELAKINPPYVALAGRGAAPDSNSYILSSGCPKGRFTQAWKGKVLGYYNGATVMFQPGPVPGQSGSGVISEIDGELWVTAVLTWLLGTEGSDDSRGGAIPIANLYEALQGQQSVSNENSESPIPPDATECSETIKRPYVLEFTQNDCPPCVEAGKTVTTVRKAGYSVKALNVSESEEARELAEKYKLEGTPTFVVCDADGKEIARYIGVDKAEAIIAALDKSALEYEAEAIVEPEKPKTEPSYANKIYSCFFFNPDEVFQTGGSFRNRQPVYDYDLTEYNAGFFADSDGAWRNRRNKQIEPPIQEEEPECPPSVDESKLGDRLKNKLNDSLNESIDLAIAKGKKEIEGAVDAKIAEIKAEIKAFINYWKWRVLFWSILIVFVIVFLTTTFFSVTLAALFEKDAETEIEEENEDTIDDIQETPVMASRSTGTARRTVKKTTKRTKR